MAASLCRRALAHFGHRRSLYTSASLLARDKSRLPDPLDLATGLEKAEMLANLAGDDDPFDTKVVKRRPSTKENPNLVGSFFKSRLIGCICEEDQIHINWIWLHQGHPRRCTCGAWYKLVERTPLKI